MTVYLSEDEVVGAARNLHSLELKRGPAAFTLVWLFFKWQGTRDGGSRRSANGSVSFTSADCEEFQRDWLELDCPGLSQSTSSRGVFFPFSGKYAFRSGGTTWAVQSFYSQLQRPNQIVKRFVQSANESYHDAQDRKVTQYSLTPNNDYLQVIEEVLGASGLSLDALAIWRYRRTPVLVDVTGEELVADLRAELELSDDEATAVFTAGERDLSDSLTTAAKPFDSTNGFVVVFPDSLSSDDHPPAPEGSVEAGDIAEKPSIERIRPEVDLLSDLLVRFRDATNASGVNLDPSTEVAALAAILSCQFLLFAGPSGTGKSTLARALLNFFVPSEVRSLIEARRQLIGPEDLAGFRSPITDSFVRGSDYEQLARLAGSAGSASPGLLVEEANLSPIEGYLAPMTHGLSGIETKTIRWHLQTRSGDGDGDGDGDAGRDATPSEFVMQPFPRLLATVNVDATAMAPSPKVSARACVLLLLAAEANDRVKAAIDALTVDVEPIEFDPAAAQLLGDPLAALHSPETEQDAIEASIEEIIRFTEDAVGRPVASRRQLAQMATYSAWFALLAQAHVGLGGKLQEDMDGYRIAAENGLLHFVLPSLPATDFSRFVTASREKVPAGQPGTLSSLLSSRVAALAAGPTSFGEGTLDFWDRLS